MCPSLDSWMDIILQSKEEAEEKIEQELSLIVDEFMEHANNASCMQRTLLAYMICDEHKKWD